MAKSTSKKYGALIGVLLMAGQLGFGDDVATCGRLKGSWIRFSNNTGGGDIGVSYKSPFDVWQSFILREGHWGGFCCKQGKDNIKLKHYCSSDDGPEGYSIQTEDCGSANAHGNITSNGRDARSSDFLPGNQCNWLSITYTDYHD